MGIKCEQVLIPQYVKVRKYEVDRQALVVELREHKTISNSEIADKLNTPITEVEHWFRKDKYGNIPNAEIWWELKELLGIKTTEFDKAITTFELRLGVFEKAERCYRVDGLCPTLMAGDEIKIICN